MGGIYIQRRRMKFLFAGFLPAVNIIEKLQAKKIQYLYPIQIATLEHIRAGHDVIAQARTGTGKTVIF